MLARRSWSKVSAVCRLASVLVGVLALSCGASTPPTVASEPTHVAAADSGCSVERPCPGERDGRWGLSYCYGPGEALPCGAANCAERQGRCDVRGRGRDACVEEQECVAGGCEARACTTDAACGSPNLVCLSGACAHRACRRSSECGGGTCIRGACFEAAGQCYYPPDAELP